jgi:TonB family protein
MKINKMKKHLSIIIFIFLTLILVGTANAQSGKKPNTSEKKSEEQQEDRPLKIISNPRISTSVFNKCLKSVRNRELLVRLRVTFHSSGEITDIQVIEDSGCEYFNNEAVRVAEKVKFNPAIKDGEPITVTKTMEYRVGMR